MVILITGKASAGKTEYATRLTNELITEGNRAVMIDGDKFREEHGTLIGKENYTDEARLQNLLNAANLAKEMEGDGYIVIMAFIAPKRAWREAMRNRWRESRVVYIPGGHLWEGTEYERPHNDELNIRRL